MKQNSLILGLHAVSALLNQQPERVLRLSVQKERRDNKIENLIKLAKQQNIAIEVTSKDSLDQMTSHANHQGIVAHCTKARQLTEADLPHLLEQIEGHPFILVLDGVQDPHNLGACFRSAEAACVDFIVAPKDKSAGITPVVSKVASGAAESVPFVQVTNLARTLEILKENGIWIYGAAGEAEENLYQSDLQGPIALVLGAEGSGLRRLTRERCDKLLKIPMQGSVSSLNVSVAAGIFLFEVVRQRNLKK